MRENDGEDIMANRMIFDIPLNTESRRRSEDRIRGILGDDTFRRIATVNPEFLVRARRDARFQKNLLAADLRIPDGFGIVLDGLLSGRRIGRYPGADLFHFVLAEAKREARPVFLLIRKDGLSSFEEIRNVLRKRYPGLSVEGAELHVGVDPIPEETKKATVVFCNFGAPEQEYALESLRTNPGNIRIAMGVGGAFDYVTGKCRRAPRWVRALGFEWLFRLAIQPGRIGRIWNATAVFLFLRLSDRMKGSRKVHKVKSS